MKKTTLFLSMFAAINSVSALNVIYKKSETSTALVRLEDINYDKYYNKSSYEAEEGLSLPFHSEFYYYKLSIENRSEDKVVVYHAQDQIKDSRIKVKKLIGKQLELLSSYFSTSCGAAIVIFGLVSASPIWTKQAVKGCLISCYWVAFGLSVFTGTRLRSLMSFDNRIKESLEVESAGIANEGFFGMKSSFKNGKGSIIIVSDHELQNVEIDIQQRNEGYYEVILTEIIE